MTIFEIITFKLEEKFLLPLPKGVTVFWDPKKPLFEVHMK
jgi:hypothetical protein